MRACACLLSFACYRGDLQRACHDRRQETSSISRVSRREIEFHSEKCGAVEAAAFSHAATRLSLGYRRCAEATMATTANPYREGAEVNESILVTTGNEIEGQRIERYLGVVR